LVDSVKIEFLVINIRRQPKPERIDKKIYPAHYHYRIRSTTHPFVHENYIGQLGRRQFGVLESEKLLCKLILTPDIPMKGKVFPSSKIFAMQIINLQLN
jgi:hypothetical protein